MTKLKHQFLIFFFGLFLATATFFLMGENFIASPPQNHLRASFLSSVGVDEESGFTLLQGSEGRILHVSASEFSDRDYVLETGDESETILEFPGDSLVRLDSNTNVRIHQVPQNFPILNLERGRMWVNTSYSRYSPSLQFREIFIPSSSAAFTLSLHEDNASIVVAKNFLNFRFLKEENFLFPYQAVRISFADFNPEIVFEDISPTLMKENSWFARNFSQDEQLRRRLIQRFTHYLDVRGVSMVSTDGVFFDVKKGLYDLSQKLVFGNEKKREYDREFLLNILDDALYFYRTADKNEAEKRFALFLDSVSDFSFKGDLFSDIDERFISLSVLNPQDFTLFPLKKAVRDLLFDFALEAAVPAKKSLADFERILLTYISDSLEAISLDFSLAQHLFRQYFVQFQKVVKSANVSIDANFHHERDLLSYLLSLSPVFYKDEFFIQQSQIDAISESLFPESQDLILLSRSSAMRQLRLYFFQEQIPLHEVRPIAFRLGKGLMEHSEFLQFLQSEFPVSPLSGATQKERFAAFQKFEKERRAVNKLQEGFFSESSGEEQKKIEDIVREIQLIFTSADFKDVLIGSLLQGDQRFVPIEKATLSTSAGDIEFSGIYDRDQGLLSGISLGDDLIYKNGVKLDKISTLLQPKIEESREILQEDFLKPVETQSEKVAKYVLAAELSKIEFHVAASQISTINFARKQFSVFGAKLPHGKQEIFVNFQFDMNSREASQIEVRTLKGIQEVSRTVSAEKLASKIREFYDKHFFEQIEKELASVKGL